MEADRERRGKEIQVPSVSSAAKGTRSKANHQQTSSKNSDPLASLNTEKLILIREEKEGRSHRMEKKKNAWF